MDREQLLKKLRKEVSEPLIQQMVEDMLNDGHSFEDVMAMANILIKNTPKVEETIARQVEGEEILEKMIAKKMDEFMNVAIENNFLTTFCLYEIDNLKDNSNLSGHFMTDGYHNVKVDLPKGELSYFQLWEHADKLYKLIQSENHKFIEEFKVVQNDGKKEIQVFFGS